MPTLTLYTKPDCSLCDDAQAALERVRARIPFELEVVDISADPELAERYGERIPVVLVDGEEAWEYVVDERELETASAPAWRRPDDAEGGADVGLRDDLLGSPDGRSTRSRSATGCRWAWRRGCRATCRS